MMKRTNRKKESRGLPGGPHEQFSYVTGVFMQDMYHGNISTEGYYTGRSIPGTNYGYLAGSDGRISKIILKKKKSEADELI